MSKAFDSYMGGATNTAAQDAAEACDDKMAEYEAAYRKDPPDIRARKMRTAKALGDKRSLEMYARVDKEMGRVTADAAQDANGEVVLAKEKGKPNAVKGRIVSILNVRWDDGEVADQLGVRWDDGTYGKYKRRELAAADSAAACDALPTVGGYVTLKRDGKKYKILKDYGGGEYIVADPNGGDFQVKYKDHLEGLKHYGEDASDAVPLSSLARACGAELVESSHNKATFHFAANSDHVANAKADGIVKCLRDGGYKAKIKYVSIISEGTGRAALVVTLDENEFNGDKTHYELKGVVKSLRAKGLPQDEISRKLTTYCREHNIPLKYLNRSIFDGAEDAVEFTNDPRFRKAGEIVNQIYLLLDKGKKDEARKLFSANESLINEHSHAPNHVIQTLRDKVNANDGADIAVGSKVQIVGGSFAGCHGLVKAVNGDIVKVDVGHGAEYSFRTAQVRAYDADEGFASLFASASKPKFKVGETVEITSSRLGKKGVVGKIEKVDANSSAVQYAVRGGGAFNWYAEGEIKSAS